MSAKHANFIVNSGDATARDVRLLAQQVRDTVQREHGVTLRYEVEFAGEWDEPETWT